MLVGTPVKIFLRFGEIAAGPVDLMDPDGAKRVSIPWYGTAITSEGDPVYDDYDQSDPNIRNYGSSGVVDLDTGTSSTSARSEATASAREYYNAPEATVVII